MRFRLVYLFSFALSAVAVYSFRSESFLMGIIGGVSSALVSIGLVLSLCFIAMTVAGSGASLRRTRKFARTVAKSVAWILVSGIIGLVLAWLVSQALIGASDFAISLETASLVSVPDFIWQRSLQGFLSEFGGQQALYCAAFAMIALLLLFSYYLNPTVKVIQPAYSLANSINEVGFRFFYTVCDIYIVFLFVISGAFFAKLFDSQSEMMMVFASGAGLFIKMAVFCMALCFVAFPILFLIFTGFRRNPFPVMWSAIITSLVSVFSANQLFSVSVMQEIHRHQNDSLKRTTVVSADLMYLFSRSGSAAIAYLAVISLLKGVSPDGISVLTQVVLLALCLCLSLFSGMFPGLECLFIVSAIRMIMPELVSDDVVLAAASYTPVMSVLGLFTDAFAMNYGCKSCDIPLSAASESA